MAGEGAKQNMSDGNALSGARGFLAGEVRLLGLVLCLGGQAWVVGGCLQSLEAESREWNEQWAEARTTRWGSEGGAEEFEEEEEEEEEGNGVSQQKLSRDCSCRCCCCFCCR